MVQWVIDPEAGEEHEAAGKDAGDAAGAAVFLIDR